MRRALAGALLAATVVAVTPGVAAGGPGPEDTERLVVHYARGLPAAASDRALAAVRFTSLERVTSLGFDVIEVPASQADSTVRALLAAPGVAAVEPDPVVEVAATPNDPHWPRQWAQMKIGATSAWDLTRGSPDVVVAVLDTGVDAAHPDLDGALVAGIDLVNEDEDPADDHVDADGNRVGHGTMVAGIVAARSNNGIGVAGMCWRCQVMAVKVLGADGSGRGSTAARGIEWAVDNGADIVNMSFGSLDTSSALEAAVTYARDRGVVVVAAAGNAPADEPVYPAAYPGVIGVAGTDEADELYPWSAYGEWVSLAAPGCVGTTKVGDRYGDLCGTSAATPLVAGTLALGRSRHPTTSVGRLTTNLLSTATDVGPIVSAGRVEARRFLDALDLAITCPPERVTDPGFADVDVSTPQGAAVACVAWWGLLGQGEIYRPGDLVTRGQMASFIARTIRVAGLPLPVVEDRFSDDDTSRHQDHINQLANAGIVGGRADGTFGPEEPVTRAQTATFLVRAVELIRGGPLPEGTDRFSDDDTSPHAANIDKAAAARLVGGRADGNFGPQENVTRLQMGDFLRNTLRYLVTSDLAVAPSA
ncbi:MAG: S8 family serine peptidase [Nitriliruptorales bacterium]